MKKTILMIFFTIITFSINNYSYASDLYMTDYITSLEEEFTINNYKGSGKYDYKYEKGNIPVLISAPHTVKQWRHNKYKCEEVYTGALIKLLGQKTNAHIIYKTSTNGDENHTINKTEYRNKIKEIVEENDIKVVIDLHGMSIKRKSDIDIGTGGVNNKNLLNEDDILFCVEDSLHNLNYTVNKYFTGGNNVTISSYCSQQLGVPTLQLEINRKLRQLDDEKFIYLVDQLSNTINNLNKHLTLKSDVYFFTPGLGIFY